MPRLQSFEILFDQSARQAYAPGQKVKGMVKVVVADEIQMRRLKLEVRGFARTHWTERHARGRGELRRLESKHYGAREDYLNEDIVLFGSEDTDCVLVPGKHEFDFSFVLPPNAISSYEGGVYGCVRYHCRGVIERPWKFDLTEKQPFLVTQCVNLSHFPMLVRKQRYQSAQAIGLFCCKRGQVTITVVTSKRGYVSGEPLLAKIELDNGSSLHIQDIALELEQEVSFCGRPAEGPNGPRTPHRSHTHRSTSVVANVALDGAFPGEHKVKRLTST